MTETREQQQQYDDRIKNANADTVADGDGHGVVVGTPTDLGRAVVTTDDGSRRMLLLLLLLYRLLSHRVDRGESFVLRRCKRLVSLAAGPLVLHCRHL